MITILIVDDEKLERRGIRFLLKREEGEFQILEATNGKDALGVLESNHVDILFSDVKMPYMNGLELTKAVREDHPDMEIVIFSGYNDFSYAREALRYGVVDYVLKPVDPEEFHKTFQRVMENISSKIEKKEQQEKKEDYLKKYFLLKYLYGGNEEDFVQFKKLTDGMEDGLSQFTRMVLVRFLLLLDLKNGTEYQMLLVLHLSYEILYPLHVWFLPYPLLPTRFLSESYHLLYNS